jgi:hypothetical protein
VDSHEHNPTLREDFSVQNWWSKALRMTFTRFCTWTLQFLIIKTWHYHSLERSWEALSVTTCSNSFRLHNYGEKTHLLKCCTFAYQDLTNPPPFTLITDEHVNWKRPDSQDETLKNEAYPYSHHCHLARFVKSDEHGMFLPFSVRRQPHVRIVSCPVDAINQICHNSWIFVVFW